MEKGKGRGRVYGERLIHILFYFLFFFFSFALIFRWNMDGFWGGNVFM